MADKAQTWVYTEDYVTESDALTAARAVATEMGASPVSPGTGAALRMLAAVSGARAVLEVGTGAGVSGLWLLDGMATDGVLTTIDSESELLGHARRNFAAAGLSSHRTRLIDETQAHKSRLFLVSSISATRAGIGKNSVSIGVAL